MLDGITRPPDPSLRDHRNRQRELALQEPLLTRRRRSLRPGCPVGRGTPTRPRSHVAGRQTKPRGSPIDDRDVPIRVITFALQIGRQSPTPMTPASREVAKPAFYGLRLPGSQAILNQEANYCAAGVGKRPNRHTLALIRESAVAAGWEFRRVKRKPFRDRAMFVRKGAKPKGLPRGRPFAPTATHASRDVPLVLR